MYTEVIKYDIPSISTDTEICALLEYLLRLAEDMNWSVCLSTGTDKYKFRLETSKGPDERLAMSFYSEGLPLNAGNLKATIETLSLVLTERRQLAQVDTEDKLTSLENKVARLEKVLSQAGLMPDGELSESPKTVITDAEYSHYLSLFQQLIPDFEKVGAVVSIDETKQQFHYRNPSSKRREIIYDINQIGYGRASDTLRSLRKIRESRPD